MLPSLSLPQKQGVSGGGRVTSYSRPGGFRARRQDGEVKRQLWEQRAGEADKGEKGETRRGEHEVVGRWRQGEEKGGGFKVSGIDYLWRAINLE